MDKIKHYVDQIGSLENNDQFNEYMMFLAKQHTPPEVNFRARENSVRGCETELWIIGQEQDGTWQFFYDANTLFTKATARIITDCCSGKSSSDIKGLDFMDFSQIAQYLSINRKRGVQLMLNHIKNIVDKQQ